MFPQGRIALQKLGVTKLVKFFAFYGTERFISMFTKDGPLPYHR